jgi:hypothetical protein
MKNTAVRSVAALLATIAMAGDGWGGCVSERDMAALKTAALQQELMVAAFSCHDIASYNHFVRAHQPELIDSDGQLKAYFVRRDGGRRGEASYHTYKTELANSSSLRSIRSTNEFCDRADADFDAVEGRAGLSAARDNHRWAIEAIYHVCGSENAPILADASAEAPSFRTELGDREAPSGFASRAPFIHRSHTPNGEPDEARSSDVKTPKEHRHLEGDSL